jgi:DsbC/DsbD-like thiol-disulfide interchange protein
MAWLQGRSAGRRLATQFDREPATDSFKRIIRESEREILQVQQRTGWDTYWRLYAWLAPLRSS